MYKSEKKGELGDLEWGKNLSKCEKEVKKGVKNEQKWLRVKESGLNVGLIDEGR